MRIGKQHIKLLNKEELVIGQKVRARFTNSYNQIDYMGIVKRINKRSVSIETIEDGINGWEKGKRFSIALPSNPIHSINNCVCIEVEE